MEWLHTLFFGNGIAHAVLTFALVITIGILLGKVKIGGVSLGITWILFVGIVLSHFGMTVDGEVRHFVQEFGLILFVFSIGLQVGPGFFASFKHGGMTLVMCAVAIVLLGVATAYVVHLVTGTPIPTMVGILSGAVTNTPGLGAAQQAYTDALGIEDPTIALGYAVAYPLGVVGIIFTMIFIRYALRVKFEKEDEGLAALSREHKLADKVSVEFTNKTLDGRTVAYVAGRNRYVGYLISLGLFSFKGKRVGLDCANGSAWTIAKSVFDALGAKTYVMGDEPDGFNINNGVGSTHIEALRRFVLANELDVGFAYDGDADRCLAVDEQGGIITGDHILYVCGRHLKQQGELPHNTVVTTIMSNFGLYRAFDREGISYAKTAVGDKYVYEYMAKNGCALGGEQSGHIIFSKYASTGDGVLTSLKLMEVMLEQKKPLSKLTEGLTIYPQVLENVRVRDKKTAREDPDVQAAVDAVAAELGDTGRVLVRESGTEPVLRVMVEAPEDAVCRQCVDRVVDVIRRNGHCV